MRSRLQVPPLPVISNILKNVSYETQLVEEVYTSSLIGSHTIVCNLASWLAKSLMSLVVTPTLQSKDRFWLNLLPIASGDSVNSTI
jgi:hypothetical protein